MDSKTFFYAFGRTLYKIDGFYAAYAKESGVKENLLWILYALNDGGEHSQKEICAAWDLPRTTVNTIVKELESAGRLTLSQKRGEKRELDLKLTQEGRAYADELLRGLYEREARAFRAVAGSCVLTEMEKILAALQAGGEEAE